MDKQRYCGKQAVMTFNVGVLLTGKVTFTPALPQRKLDAIDSFLYPLYVNMYVLFSETFWDSSFYSIGRATNIRGDYPLFYLIGNYFHSKPPLLLWFTGDKAISLITQDLNTTKQQIYAALRLI